MVELAAYNPSPQADQALRKIAQLAYTMPDGDGPAACCPLVENLGGINVVQELLANRMVRELPDQDPADGIRVGMTDVGLNYIATKLESGDYIVEEESQFEEDWENLSGPQA